MDPAGITMHSPESRVVYFDFGLQDEWSNGDSLLSSPAPFIVSPPQGLVIAFQNVTAGKKSFQTSAQANFLISGWSPGSTYLLICQGQTSQGRTIAKRGRVTCDW